VTWLTDAAAILSGGSHPPCAADHERHETTTIHVDGSHGLHDWPQLPPLDFRLDVFRADLYSVPAYCPADSEVSRGLLAHACWEAYGSVLALAILSSGSGICVDFGANVGWYSLLALSRGAPVLAVEADPVIAQVLHRNLRRYEPDEVRWSVARGWIDSDTPQLPAGPHVRLIKADVEGLEPEVMRVCEPLLISGSVDFVIAEASPCFGSTGWVARVAALGFDVFVIPDKGSDPLAFAADPIGETTRHPYEAAAFDRHQADLLLVRTGVR